MKSKLILPTLFFSTLLNAGTATILDVCMRTIKVLHTYSDHALEQELKEPIELLNNLNAQENKYTAFAQYLKFLTRRPYYLIEKDKKRYVNWLFTTEITLMWPFTHEQTRQLALIETYLQLAQYHLNSSDANDKDYADYLSAHVEKAEFIVQYVEDLYKDAKAELEDTYNKYPHYALITPLDNLRERIALFLHMKKAYFGIKETLDALNEFLASGKEISFKDDVRSAASKLSIIDTFTEQMQESVEQYYEQQEKYRIK